MGESSRNNAEKWHQRKGMFMSLGFEIQIEAVVGLLMLGVALYFFAHFIVPVIIGLCVVAVTVAIISAGGA